MTCEHCKPTERRTPWRVRRSFFSPTLWTVFELDPDQHGAGHTGYASRWSYPTFEVAMDQLHEHAGTRTQQRFYIRPFQAFMGDWRYYVIDRHTDKIWGTFREWKNAVSRRDRLNYG